MNFHHNYNVLQTYISQEVYQFILPYLEHHSVGIRISKPRKTKLADYRPKFKNQGHRITINQNLGPYYFSITLVHEVAHLLNWINHKDKVAPHGDEWKIAYRHLMSQLLTKVDWPKKLVDSISLHLEKINASTCADPELFKTLNSYDNRSEHLKYLDCLPLGTVFEFNGRVFKKGNKLRTRCKCLELSSNRNYLINCIAQVEIVDK